MWLPEHARDAMLDDAMQEEPRETGGILMGYEASDETVVITNLVGPGPRASFTFEGFEPDGPWQEREVARIYLASGRHTTYLGDWHSHPNGSPTPSRRDNRTARLIARHRPARLPRPLMLIASRDGGGWKITAFRLKGRKLRSIELKLYARPAL